MDRGPRVGRAPRVRRTRPASASRTAVPTGGRALHAEFDGVSGPLDGVRVLDLSIALTGPYAAALLADQGAAVDQGRAAGHRRHRAVGRCRVNGMSSLYLVCNRGKRSIAVDLQTPAGLDIVRRLAADTDVLIQNFRPGVMDQLGLGYDDVARDQPRRRLRVALRVRRDGPVPRSQRLRHGDPGVRRLRRQPGRSRRRHPGVPPADGGRQGDGAVRGAGDHRRAVRAGAGPGRPARRAFDDRRRCLVPVGRLRGERGAARGGRHRSTRASSPASGRCGSPTAGAS